MRRKNCPLQREQLEFMGCCLGMDEKLMESLCARIKRRTGRVGETLCRQTDRNSLTFAGPGPQGQFQQPQHQLEGQHSRAEIFQEVLA